ncbi:MAG: hypothetical protein ABFS12_11775 [Bacteroidota bacterium]
MMNIYNHTKFNKHVKEIDYNTHSKVYEVLLAILLFGSMGAITWAIRGTSGWGGVDGTVIPGIMWGILWYYLAYRKGIDARGIVLWLGLGIALGGELGYGQYVSWIRGIFYVGNETIGIDPWLGYFWFTMCGIGWAAPGGILLGWALGKRVSPGRWIVRSLLLMILLILLFAWPIVEWVGMILVQSNSSILFPNADLGIYSNDLGKHLSRTVYTNTQNFTVVIWWIIALLESLLQRDRTTVVTGLIIGGGFGLGFMLSALWTLGYGIAPDYIDWWKIWELNSGFNLGVLYVITFYWAIRQLVLVKKSEENNIDKSEVETKYSKWRDTIFLALTGFILLFFVGFEYFFWTGLVLSLFYFFSMCLTTSNSLDIHQINERRKNVSFLFSIYFLVFIMFHGGSERLGVILELYEEDAVSQYSWPIERIFLFIPAALVITSVVIVKMKHILKDWSWTNNSNIIPSNLSVRIIELMTIMGFIGALSIWPSKIGVLYGLFLVSAIFAFNRLERRFNMIDF